PAADLERHLGTAPLIVVEAPGRTDRLLDRPALGRAEGETDRLALRRIEPNRSASEAGLLLRACRSGQEDQQEGCSHGAPSDGRAVPTAASGAAYAFSKAAAAS